MVIIFYNHNNYATRRMEICDEPIIIPFSIKDLLTSTSKISKDEMFDLDENTNRYDLSTYLTNIIKLFGTDEKYDVKGLEPILFEICNLDNQYMLIK